MANAYDTHLALLFSELTKIVTGEKEIAFVREINLHTGVNELMAIKVQNARR